MNLNHSRKITSWNDEVFEKKEKNIQKNLKKQLANKKRKKEGKIKRDRYKDEEYWKLFFRNNKSELARGYFCDAKYVSICRHCQKRVEIEDRIYVKFGATHSDCLESAYRDEKNK